MSKSCLLSFSGGLDSLAAAIKLKDEGYEVTLGHITWLIQGTDFGQEQTKAAHALAEELDLPVLILGRMLFPEYSYAKFAWVPMCIATIMHHAGDPCEYPSKNAMRYDAVAFGTDFRPDPEYDNSIRYLWLMAMRAYIYGGEVLYPLDGMRDKERAALVPKRLRDMTVCCYLGRSAAEPCGKCWKCLR